MYVQAVGARHLNHFEDIIHYMYVLQALDNCEVFYIGCSSDLKKRFASHNAGENKSTRAHQWRLVYYEAFLTLSGARKREFRLKSNRNANRQLMKRIKETLE